jgi:hypothetical protein
MQLALWIFLLGFIISQFLIVLSPWAGALSMNVQDYHRVLFVVSFLMVVGIGLMLRSAFVTRA